VPEPGQLRAAVATFAAARPDVACLQARLAIDNTDDNWLTRLFSIEYATLFDVINPGLARLDMPIPLGGTSNHFRTSVLEELHGWDPWNVTEDADLGIRLALSGYRVDDLPSTTWEEAPSTLPAWLRQRTRWMKGFMQVIVTHSRHPIRALRDLGPLRFVAAITLTLGTVATALGYPFFVVVVIAWILSGSLPGIVHPIGAFEAAVGLNLLVAGFVAITAPAVTALRRRGWLARLWPFVAVLPLYFGLMTVAAWRGLFELALKPFRWNKTEHGLARTSRTGRITTNLATLARRRPPDGSG
jgi:cellulose synthase/poly-beta-1,6-N-acetylglucosamine synthase-like glycosyltransferase